MSFDGDVERRDVPEETEFDVLEPSLEALDHLESIRVEARAVDPNRAEVAEEVKVDSIAKTLRGIKELQPQEWQKLSDQERLGALDKVSEIISKEYGIQKPAVALIADRRRGLQGLYDPDNRALYINRLAVRGPDGKLSWEESQTTLDTLLHEMRHAFQRDVVKDLQNGYKIHDQAEVWYDNFREYIYPWQDFKRYWNQPVEKDAREFAEKVRSTIYRV